jgi:hypothetical protein
MKTLTAMGVLLACASGCGVGSVSTGDDIGDDDTTLPANALCQSELTITGTFATSTVPPPTEDLGCVPQGTWTLEIAVADVGDCEAAPVSDTYVYTVSGEGATQMIDYTGAAGEELTSGIHAGGNGQCEGSFEHIWAATDGEFHVAQLSPYFAPGTATMLGSGTYQLWTQHP